MAESKKLIEVALPIKEISAESVRDKSIRHGHISTLHLWWARRPLPVCRAVVFASLIPDPEDPNCPQAFKNAVTQILGKKSNEGDPYKPYADIPYTAAFDQMEDTLRNRLLMFIGKFSDEFVSNEKSGKSTSSGKQLSDHSLIKWDNKNNEQIIGKARQLIWVAYNAKEGASTQQLLADFDDARFAIKNAEDNLYSLTDRHLKTIEVIEKETALKIAIESFLEKMPKVFDPFAGGGAIPLEAARLGCRSYGNDINPVAHIIQKGSLEFPQKYGKPIIFSKEEFIKIYGVHEFEKVPNEQKVFNNGDVSGIKIANRLAFDVEYYAKMLLSKTDSEIGHLYPPNKNGRRPNAYYWARMGICSNPSCKAEVPLLRQFYLSNTKSNQVFLSPIIKGTQIDFVVENGICGEEGWISRGSLKCPCCGSITDNGKLKRQLEKKETPDRLIAIIENSDKEGKIYRIPTAEELIPTDIQLNDFEIPNERLPTTYTKAMAFCLWGYQTWGDVFSARQTKTINSFVTTLNSIKAQLGIQSEYYNAVITYLSILIDRIAVVNTSFGRWDVTRENIQSPFSRQAIAMVFDYPESNPFSLSSGSFHNQLEWVIRYINSESKFEFHTVCNNASSGDKYQFDAKSVTASITDPPYYDAIAYADLSDFFYVWLKRTLGDVYPQNFSTPQTPKTEECTALKHHHSENSKSALSHFENKLMQIFDALEHQTSDLVSIMFAHQSTEAWTTLCNSILGARMNITGSWAIDTELENRSVGLAGAALASSVTVSCRPSQRSGFGEYKVVKKAIEKTVAKEVEELYSLGFRGADLLTACFGQAVSEFGKYEKVEKADGSEVIVAELLEMARESAFNALLKGFDGDEFTKFYIGWLQLNGFSESDFDDVATFAKAGLSINVSQLFKENILIKNGNKQTLGRSAERVSLSNTLGMKPDSFLIDHVHKAMVLFKGTNRIALLNFINDKASSPDSGFWRVVTAIDELLPKESEDQILTKGLIANKESLLRESKLIQKEVLEQGKLEL